MRSGPVPWSAVAVVSALLTGIAGYLTARGLALYGDGAHYLLNVVRDGTVFGPDGRLFVLVAHQLPLLLGVWLGVTDLHVLTLLLGVGQLVLPALVWSSAIALARSSLPAFALVSMAAGLVTGATSLFSVGEGTLAVPLTVLVAVLLWAPEPWRPGRALLAVGSAALLVESHESVALTSALLVVWGVLRARRSLAPLDRVACLGVSALSAVASAHAVVGLVQKRDDPLAHSLLDAVESLHPPELYAGLLAGACLFGVLYLPLADVRRALVIAVGALFALVAAIGLLTTDGDPYAARGGAEIAAVLVSAALLVLWLRGDAPAGGPRPRVSPTVAIWLPVAFAAVPLVALVPRADRFADSLDLFRAAVDDEEGVVPVEQALPVGRRQVLFDWTSSSLSVVVRGRPDAAVLVDPAPPFIPFPPEQAQEQLPPRYTWR